MIREPIMVTGKTFPSYSRFENSFTIAGVLSAHKTLRTIDMPYTIIPASMGTRTLLSSINISFFSCSLLKSFHKPPVESFSFNDGPNAGFTSDVPVKQDFSDETNGVTDWKVGDKVIHRKLGEGVVVALNGDDIIEVEFEEQGRKKILANHPAVRKG